MARYLSCVTISLLLLMMMLQNTKARNCQYGLLARCFNVYKKELAKYPGEQNDHCHRLQALVTCFTRDPSCSGDVIDGFRYWMSQMAIMDDILHVCPQIEYSDLKAIVQNTDVARKHHFIDDVVRDGFMSCAVDVHKKCVKYYTRAIRYNHMICKEASALNKCYASTAKKMKCNAPIVKDFSHMVDDVASKVVYQLHEQMNAACSV